MSTGTSKKAAEFAANSLRKDDRSFRPITDVPGIGPASADVLAESGFKLAVQLVAQFLQFSSPGEAECDKDLMEAWLGERLAKVNPQARYVKACVTALAEWVANHV
jgi:hypothetical protein